MARRSKSSGSGAGKFFAGFLLALLLAGIAAVAYLHPDKLPTGFWNKPVSKPSPSTNAPISSAKPLVRPAPDSRNGHDLKPPFGISEDVFEAGAHVYRAQCASCHGTPGHDGAFARRTDPAAQQLWRKHAHGDAVGVSGVEVGEIYWKIANGVRQTGMPSYKAILSDTQMWQISLLLKSADQPLPDPVEQILNAKP